MGQKINPVSLRIQSQTRHFDNSWYSKYFYKNLITKDIFLKNYFDNFLKIRKLSAGRYSIQHLQKETYIYNFFCKSLLRDILSKKLGFTRKKNSLKKNRYFFKTKNQKQNSRNYRTKKLLQFYTQINQTGFYKINKKITSFQNWKLWSTLTKKQTVHSFWSFFSEKREKKDSNLWITSPIPLYFSVMKIKRKNSMTKDQKKTSNKLKINNSLKIGNLSLKHHRSFIFSPPSLKTELSIINFYLIKQLFVYNLLKLRKNSSILNNKSLIRNDLLNKSSKKIVDLFSPTSISNAFDFTKIPLVDTRYKHYLQSSFTSVYNSSFKIISFKVKNDWQYASFLADEIVYFLEKRIPFRRLKKALLKYFETNSSIRGVRITCSGRVGGKSKKAQRAKTEFIKFGQTPLHVFSSQIDFSCKTAHTSFGSVGVKVWICYDQ
jgi:ribosomal protein S3